MKARCDRTKYYESIQALIGNTPLVKLTHLDLPEGVNIFAKLELYNPGGSVKDRAGKYMIEDAERKQTLMRALGAEIVNTPREEGMLGATARAEALRASIPGAVSLKQFETRRIPWPTMRRPARKSFGIWTGRSTIWWPARAAAAPIPAS